MKTRTIGTFNIRCDWTPNGPTAWTVRREGVRAAIASAGFEILGVQEAYLNQANFLTIPGEWEYVGVGRDDGDTQGEFAAIFYDPRHYSLLQSGNFWLSETPEQPSFGWDADCIRICTWAKFQDRDTDTDEPPFYFFNCHLDHRGLVARERSAELLLTQIAHITGGEGKTLPPLFLVGDFNMTVEEAAQRRLADALNDSIKASEIDPPVGTFTGFALEEAIGLPIDHIFVSDAVRIQQYTVLPNRDENGLLISDHRPVVVVAELFPSAN